MKIEYIEWLDCCGMDGWHDPTKAKEEEKHMVVQSIGWVTDETDDALILTGHIHKSHQHHHAAMAIPKCAITKRVTIGEGGSDE